MKLNFINLFHIFSRPPDIKATDDEDLGGE